MTKSVALTNCRLNLSSASFQGSNTSFLDKLLDIEKVVEKSDEAPGCAKEDTESTVGIASVPVGTIPVWKLVSGGIKRLKNDSIFVIPRKEYDLKGKSIRSALKVKLTYLKKVSTTC